MHFCDTHPSPLVEVDVAVLQKERQGDLCVTLVTVKYRATSRATYIQPVFDCRVQHGEVCEEDSQVRHRALGAGLYKKKRKKKI